MGVPVYEESIGVQRGIEVCKYSHRCTGRSEEWRGKNTLYKIEKSGMCRTDH